MAGQFYPADAATLQAAAPGLPAGRASRRRPERPVAMVVPHAGYIYSGQITADAFRQAAAHRYDIVVIIGANHTAPGFDRIAIYPGTGFRTPLGVAEIDSSVAEALVREDADCVFDQAAHAREHSVEVQVPFVQHLFPGAKIVPIVVGTDDPAVCRRFGRALAKVLKDRQRPDRGELGSVALPAARDAPAVDRRTLEAIASLDPDTLLSSSAADMATGHAGLADLRCGAAPIVAAMVAAGSLGATRGVVVSYANSADVVVGDPDRVVGYGAVI